MRRTRTRFRLLPDVSRTTRSQVRPCTRDAESHLSELRHDELSTVALSLCALLCSLLSTQLYPAAALPLFVGGAWVGVLGIRAMWRASGCRVRYRLARSGVDPATLAEPEELLEDVTARLLLAP